MDNLDRLPAELIRVILGNIDAITDLYQCALVNRFFYATTSQLFWRAPIKKKLVNGLEEVTCSLAEFIIQAIHLNVTHPIHAVPLIGNHIRQLLFGSDDHVLDILNIIPFCPLVEQLELNGQAIGDKGMERIFRNTRGLKIIKLCSLGLITDKTIAFMKLWCPLVHDVELRCDGLLTTQTLITLKDYVLTRLVIFHCKSIKEDGIRPLIPGFTQLTHLTVTPLSDSDLLGVLTPTTSDSTPLALLECVEFRTGHLHDSNDRLVSFVKTHPRLHTLGLNYATIDDTLLPALVQLQHLKLMNTIVTRPFTMIYPQLRELCLIMCQMDGDTFCSMATAIPNMQRLVIRTLYGLADADVQYMIQQCSQLTFVDLFYPNATVYPLRANVSKILYKEDIDRIRNNHGWE